MKKICSSLFFFFWVYMFFFSRADPSLSTYASTLTSSVFVETSRSIAEFGVFFVQASAGLSLPLIHRTSVISLFSYDSRRDIMSIISLFSLVVPSLTRQSYRDFESEHIITGICGMLSVRTICWRVVLSAIALSNPLTIPYSSLARTLRVTLLHLVEFQCTMLP